MQPKNRGECQTARIPHAPPLPYACTTLSWEFRRARCNFFLSFMYLVLPTRLLLLNCFICVRLPAVSLLQVHPIRRLCRVLFLSRQPLLPLVFWLLLKVFFLLFFPIIHSSQSLFFSSTLVSRDAKSTRRIFPLAGKSLTDSDVCQHDATKI